MQPHQHEDQLRLTHTGCPRQVSLNMSSGECLCCTSTSNQQCQQCSHPSVTYQDSIVFCHFVQEQRRRIRSGLTARCTTHVGVPTNRSFPDYTTLKTVQNFQLLVPSYTVWTGLYHSGSLCGSHQPSSLKYQMLWQCLHQ